MKWRDIKARSEAVKDITNCEVLKLAKLQSNIKLDMLTTHH